MAVVEGGDDVRRTGARGDKWALRSIGKSWWSSRFSSQPTARAVLIGGPPPSEPSWPLSTRRLRDSNWCQWRERITHSSEPRQN